MRRTPFGQVRCFGTALQLHDCTTRSRRETNRLSQLRARLLNWSCKNSLVPNWNTMDEPFNGSNFADATGDDEVVRAVAVDERPGANADAHDWREDPRLRSLDPRQVTVERIVGWISVAVLATIAFVTLVVLTAINWPPSWGVGLIALGMLVMLSLLAWQAQVWPPIAYRWSRYIANNEGLQIYRGVLWRSVINVPRSRIQHTDVRQGPIQRRYGIGKLIVHTAGTQFAAIELDGLSREQALALRDLLTAGEAKHDAV